MAAGAAPRAGLQEVASAYVRILRAQQLFFATNPRALSGHGCQAVDHLFQHAFQTGRRAFQHCAHVLAQIARVVAELDPEAIVVSLDGRPCVTQKLAPARCVYEGPLLTCSNAGPVLDTVAGKWSPRATRSNPGYQGWTGQGKPLLEALHGSRGQPLSPVRPLVLRVRV